MKNETKREMICIACPIGCRLTVTPERDGSVSVTGNSCPRGIEYGKEEYFAPRRVVTATVGVRDIAELRLPVKTDHPIPKELISGLLSEAYAIKVPLPVGIGDVVLEDYHGTGVNLVATKAVSAGKGSGR